MPRQLNPWLRPLMLRRNGTSWEWAPQGGNTDWRPLAGSEGMTPPEAIVLTAERTGQQVLHVDDAPARLQEAPMPTSMSEGDDTMPV